MSITFDDITAGRRLAGVVADGEVTVVAATPNGEHSLTLVYRTDNGELGDRIITADTLETITKTEGRRWTFDADGAHFRLASEARRMKWAHLADPFAAVDTSNIEPYPHQIEAVYQKFLPQRPLRYLLADDPGAGKTIMAGLLIRELMLRGDVARCLIVAPGSLVEQWQDEMWDKFGVDFEIMSRHAVEASRSGNPFTEKNLLVARVDQLARAEDPQEKLKGSDWDLIIVDEAHKMSAHRYGNELKKTQRFALGELLRDRTRHLLLMTATPHNGQREDFLSFMTLLDPERFAGRLRDGKERRELAAEGEPIPVPELPRGVKFADLEDFDFDDIELEELENITIDAATAAATADELEARCAEMRERDPGAWHHGITGNRAQGVQSRIHWAVAA